MKKVLMGVGGVLVVAVVGLLGAAAMQPDTTHVERSATMKASPADIYAYANDFKKFREWNPWDEMDPNIKLTYSSETPVGKGAWYTWEGNDQVGKGKMSIKETVENQKVVNDLEFIEPFPSTAVVTFTLTPEGENTKVTWGFDAPNNFMSKMFGLFVDMDEMLGKDFQHGLDKLKVAAEKSATERLAAEKAEAEAKAAAEAQAAVAGGTPTEGAAPAAPAEGKPATP